MESKLEKLKNSRIKVVVKAVASDLEHALEHALAHTTAHAAVKGFRPGKAPKPLLIQTVGKGRILSELVDHAIPELLDAVVREHKISLIETPSYTLEKLCELNDEGSFKAGTTLEFTAEADYAPAVKVGDYTTIKIKPAKAEEATDKTVTDVLDQLLDRRATFEAVERSAKEGDRVEIDFTGKRNGIPEDRLASKNHPIIIGSKTMIPGFEEQLLGKKAGDRFSFEITFPADYHAKDMANEKVIFDIKIHQVAEKKQPKLDEAFAKEFGHSTVEELKSAIKQEREFAFAEKAKETDQETTLEAFLKLIEVDVPQSLIERELDRQIDTMREQVTMLGMNFDHYLDHLKKTEEQLREEMRPTAEKAVTIGLGLGEVVEREGLERDKNAGQAAIERLVEIATQTGKAK